MVTGKGLHTLNTLWEDELIIHRDCSLLFGLSSPASIRGLNSFMSEPDFTCNDFISKATDIFQVRLTT